jgi:predicted nucleotidyltransferase
MSMDVARGAAPSSSICGEAEAPLDRLLRRIVEVMNPLEIWLFGSRAEGRERPSSDYDLLVVMPDGTCESDLDPVRAWRLGWEAQVTADIIPCTRSEFDEEKHEIDSMPRAAFLRGRKLYER